jgi:hypothetical protein
LAARVAIAYSWGMAISAVSSVGIDSLSLFRAGSAPPRDRRAQAVEASADLARVQPIPALAGREDAEGSAGSSAAAASGMAGPTVAGRPAGANVEARVAGAARPSADPRGPESIVAERREESRRTDDAARRREAGSRLDDLLGQKSAMERKQAEEKGSRASEVMAQLSQLKARDGEVRAHEAAHIATGGRYITSGASYSYQRGPDGAQYAVGGEVGIDSSPAPGKPEETVQKMRVVRAAALAPSEPSGADLAVAAAASQTEAAALAEIAQRNIEEAARSYARESERGSPAGGSPGPPASAGSDREARGVALDMVA